MEKNSPVNDFKRKFPSAEKYFISFRCYDNSDVIVTLIITKFLSLSDTTLEAIFFPNLCYGDVVHAQTWEV